ncbi:MAG: helix-turn-helix transcriptional regulator [Roseivivax sp.]|nr:helix-turn-helix transcriptional regulator [Roseivivax sp.]
MSGAESISRIAALIAEPANAKTLSVLMTADEMTAPELSRAAGLTQRVTVDAISQLTHGGLVRVRKVGQRHYCKLTGPEVASTLQGLVQLDSATRPSAAEPEDGTHEDPALLKARLCHNHLAGEMGTRMYRSLFMRGVIVRVDDTLQLTEIGRQFVEGFGINLNNLGWGHSQASMCRPCLNWAKQQNHLAGSLGGAFLLRIYALGWAQRQRGSQIIRFTPEGEAAFKATFPVPG